MPGLCHILYIAQKDFFIYLVLCLMAVKNRLFLAELGRTDAKKTHYKAHNALQKDFHLLFICSWSEKSSERIKASQRQRAQLLRWATHWRPALLPLFPGTKRGLRALSEYDKSEELFQLLSVCSISLHTI